MSDRYPLIANPDTKRIEELSAGDNLNLTNNGIVGATTVTAERFVGFLQGAALEAESLTTAENILTGTISSERLSGSYNIGVGTATFLADASNIITGTISSERLSGDYDIGITGIARTATNLQDAANITDGIVNADRLSGVYNIDITGSAYNSVGFSSFLTIGNEQENKAYYVLYGPDVNKVDVAVSGDPNGLTYNPSLNRVGIATTNPRQTLDVNGIVTATSYRGDGSTLSGIVTTLIPGIGITFSNATGKGQFSVSAFNPVGKTIFVNQNGSDSNTGLAVNNAKRTIKAAAAIALPGDTIKVYPGVYVENNPVIIGKTVTLEGLELRNCIVTPQNPGKDLFHVNNSTHITNFSFIGAASTGGAAIVAFQPLLGVSTDRFFDAARMIRYNLDFIASETVGYLTSTDYRNPAFSIPTGNPTDCKDDLKDIFKAVIYDITRGGNSKCVGAGKTYYTTGGALQHIVGVKTETIDAIRYAADIARAVVNNSTWGGKPVESPIVVATASYNNVTGITTITATNHGLVKNDAVKVVGLGFTCPSGPGIITYPSGTYGYIFNVKSVINSNTFEVVVGQSTLPHTYVSGGTIQKHTNYQNEYTQLKDLSMQTDPLTGFNNAVNGCANVVSAIYSCVGVVTTIIGNGLGSLGPTGIRTTYPGNAGIGTTNPNDPSFSPGVGPITQGPYIRNCTNFIPDSIGLKVDGFAAEPGDQNDIGVTGSMSVDSYTQYNQGGIGVSITNGGYAQLVSIFTICDDKAIFTSSGGQCDLTNSNSSFGNYGLYSDGVGDERTKSIYRYTGTATTEIAAKTNIVTVSGVGTNRPYDGQVVYFGDLYNFVETISVTNGGSGYTVPPKVTISAPEGQNGITVQAIASIENGSVTGVTILNSGSQYLNVPTVTIGPPIGIGSTATAVVSKLQPIYYKVASATLPSAGITTVTLVQTLNNTVSAGTTAYFSRQSLQIATTISLEYVGAGTNIDRAKPALGGVSIQENEVVQDNGGLVVYTSTDQGGNFRIGDGVAVNQATGAITGRDFVKSLFTTMTPFILALSE